MAAVDGCRPLIASDDASSGAAARAAAAEAEAASARRRARGGAVGAGGVGGRIRGRGDRKHSKQDSKAGDDDIRASSHGGGASEAEQRLECSSCAVQ
jgi:hypothetical protein